jgi:type I restriction enzyme S subunit
MKVSQINDSQDHISEKAIASSSAKLIEPPAVLLVVRGMILAHTLPVAVSRVPLAINQDMKAMITNDGHSPEYISYMIRGAEPILLRAVEIAGHGTRRLRTETWTNLQIPILAKSAESLLVERLTMIERISRKISNALNWDRYQLLTQSILKKAFAGEL